MFQLHEKRIGASFESSLNQLNLGSAQTIIELKSMVDYKNHDITYIHCIEPNKNAFKIETMRGDEVVFPPNSFVKGAIYPINFRRIKNNGEGVFFAYIK